MGCWLVTYPDGLGGGGWVWVVTPLVLKIPLTIHWIIGAGLAFWASHRYMYVWSALTSVGPTITTLSGGTERKIVRRWNILVSWFRAHFYRAAKGESGSNLRIVTFWVDVIKGTSGKLVTKKYSKKCPKKLQKWNNVSSSHSNVSFNLSKYL